MKFKIFLIIVFLFLSCPAWSATYYVKNGGNDEAAGTSDGTAWATVAKATSAAVHEGDTVYFNSGDTWEVSGDYPFNCVVGVIYDGKTYGDGTRATLQYSGSTAYSVVMINGTPSNTANRSTFRGFNVDIHGGRSTGIGIGTNQSASYVTIDDCLIHDTDYSQATNWYYALTCGYGSGDVSEVIVQNCTMYNIAQEALCAYVTENGSVRSTIFRGNTIHTTGLSNGHTGWGAGIEIKNDVDGLIIEYNTIYDNNYAGIHIHHDSYGTPTNITMRYNIIHSNVCGIFWQGGDGTHYVYGNLFYNNGYHANDVIVSVDGDIHLPNVGTFYVYNNSIHRSVSAGSSGGAIHVGTGGTVEVKNNAIYATEAPGYYDNSNIATHSDNLIYRSSGTAVTDNSTNYTSAQITDWDNTAIGTDPAFVGGTLPTGFSGTYGTNMVPNTDYFQLTADSPAKDTGYTIEGYTGCINGAGLTTPITRPLGSAYDIGAYEYGSAGSSGSAACGFLFQGVTIK